MKITKGSGNVFKDLGLPNAEELQQKAILMQEVTKRLNTLDLNDPSVYDRYDITKIEVSNILTGKFNKFSLSDMKELYEKTENLQ